MTRLRLIVFSCGIILTATLASELAVGESSGVQPKIMEKPSEIDDIASSTGHVHWRRGVFFTGPMYVTAQDGDRTVVTLIVTRKNASDANIELCGLFSFLAVARFGVDAIPEDLARAVLPQSHDCKSVTLEPGEAAHDSLTYSFVGTGSEGRVRLHCVYYPLAPDGTVGDPLDMGSLFVPFE